MKTLFIFLLFILPVYAISQVTITGKVTDPSGSPIAGASVFLSNALAGTATRTDGTFVLTNAKNGQYDMVVSFIGFETHHQNITVNNANIDLPAIVLVVKNNQLHEVKIGPPDPNRNKYLERFMKEFLGQSQNVPECKILNPEILDLEYHKANNTLTASSDDFLIVENKALGYKIHYQLTHFIIQYDPLVVGKYTTYYDGNVFFENMTGSPSQQKKWDKARLNTYLGSSMHFLRSIITNKTDEDGFTVLRLMRKPNTARPNDSLIRAKLAKFSYRPGILTTSAQRDSAMYWQEMFNRPMVYEVLAKQPLVQSDYVKRIDAKNIYALSFTDFLYIAYPKKPGQKITDPVLNPGRQESYFGTVVGLNTKFAIFDQNGIFVNPNSTVFEGSWGKSGTADLLPVDYEPTVP